jgi:excisionase family DNA binding protein
MKTGQDSQHDVAPLFVRLPAAQADKLARAAFELGTSKKSLVSALVARYVDPDDEAGLRDLQATAGGSRRRVIIETGPDTPAVGRAVFFPSEQPEVLTAAQAAQLLQLDVATVEDLASGGELPGRKLAGHWRFARSAILRWLDGGARVETPLPPGDADDPSEPA